MGEGELRLALGRLEVGGPLVRAGACPENVATPLQPTEPEFDALVADRSASQVFDLGGVDFVKVACQHRDGFGRSSGAHHIHFFPVVDFRKQER